MRRSAIFLLTTSGCARAAWLRWSVDHEAVWPAKETGHVVAESDAIGWTPRPTPAPGVRGDGEQVLDLLRRQSDKTDWTNSQTCGWLSGISSSAFQCLGGYTCATNQNHAVACVSGTISQFFTACLDYSAFEAGSCLSLDPATGCCEQKTRPACGTYIWTGEPERFMYQCFETASIVSMLDVPQFVLDASRFSKTHTTPKPTTTESETGPGASVTSPNSGHHTQAGGNPGSGDGNPASDTSGNTTTSGSKTNTPVIVGGAVGGVLALLLLLLLLWYLRRKAKAKLGLGFTRNKETKKENNARQANQTTILDAAVAKGRQSSGSETTMVAPIPLKVNPQHRYHNGEEHNHNHHHHHNSYSHARSASQSRPVTVQLQEPRRSMSQSRGSRGGTERRVSNNNNNNNNNNTSYTPAPGAPHNITVGGVVSKSQDSDTAQRRSMSQSRGAKERVSAPHSNTHNTSYTSSSPNDARHNLILDDLALKAADTNTSLQQQQQQLPQAQLQPINVHVYYTPAPAPAPASHPQQKQPPLSKTQPSREEQRERISSQDRNRDQEQGTAHKRDVSNVSSRSVSPGFEWMAGGPGYRQSM
ncbi:hypothetical protein GGS21DRAFT_519441 [Xylaria nigripes]|nr:hypothetical protein GGS21DRAFT_519441 [Xylaria nigripes]